MQMLFFFKEEEKPVFQKLNHYFTPAEKWLWSLSVLGILSSYLAFGGESLLTLAASLQ